MCLFVFVSLGQLAARQLKEQSSSRRNKSSRSRDTPTKELKAGAAKVKAKPTAVQRNNSKSKNI